MDFYYKLK